MTKYLMNIGYLMSINLASKQPVEVCGSGRYIFVLKQQPKGALFPRDAQRAVLLKLSGSKSLFVTSLA